MTETMFKDISLFKIGNNRTKWKLPPLTSGFTTPKFRSGCKAAREDQTFVKMDDLCNFTSCVTFAVVGV